MVNLKRKVYEIIIENGKLENDNSEKEKLKNDDSQNKI